MLKSQQSLDTLLMLCTTTTLMCPQCNHFHTIKSKTVSMQISSSNNRVEGISAINEPSRMWFQRLPSAFISIERAKNQRQTNLVSARVNRSQSIIEKIDNFIIIIPNFLIEYVEFDFFSVCGRANFRCFVRNCTCQPTERAEKEKKSNRFRLKRLQTHYRAIRRCGRMSGGEKSTDTKRIQRIKNGTHEQWKFTLSHCEEIIAHRQLIGSFVRSSFETRKKCVDRLLFCSSSLFDSQTADETKRKIFTAKQNKKKKKKMPHNCNGIDKNNISTMKTIVRRHQTVADYFVLFFFLLHSSAKRYQQFSSRAAVQRSDRLMRENLCANTQEKQKSTRIARFACANTRRAHKWNEWKKKKNDRKNSLEC